MAMTCVKGRAECGGCMACQVSEEIGICAECKEPIEYGEAHYAFSESDMIHEDCLSDWAKKYLR